MSDTTFTTWGLDENPVTIDYSLVVLEEIRHEVNQGLLKIARGGIEVGGVLYGVCDGRKVRVEAMRPIACSHSQGPAFVLSDEDMNGLEQQMREDLQDPHLNGLVCVGWFVSHNRGEMELTERDNDLFTRFFPDSWQVTLLVRPGRGSSTKAGFFVREPDGSVKLSKPHKEFDFPDRLAGVLDRVAKRERPAESRKGFRELPQLEPPPAPVNIRGAVQGQGAYPYDAGAFGQQYYEGQMPMPQPGRGGGSGKMWMFVAVAAIIVLGAAGAAMYYSGIMVPPKPETLGLAMADRTGTLQIEWNASSSAMLTARRGELHIVDGGQSQDIPLVIGDLLKGRSTYARKSGDVEVRLSVEGANGAPQTESTHFVGQPPATAAPKEDVQVLDDRKAELEAEVERLKATNASQADRIQQLQRSLTILQTRLGMAQSPEPQQ